MSGFNGFLGKVGLVVATSVATAALAGTGVAAASAVIPNNSVSSPKIVNNTVKSADIKNNSIHSIDITDNNVTGVDIADGSLGSGDVADGSLTTFDLADGTVASEDIADATVTGTDVQNGSIGASDLAALLLPRWAKIDADASGASMIRGRGAVGAQRVSAGQYAVTFLQDVTTCGWSATVNDNDTGSAGPLYATVERDGPNSNSILRVRTFDATGALVDPTTGDGFTVTVTC